MQAKWIKGTWLGRAERSDEDIVSDHEGVHTVRTIRRLVGENKHDVEILKKRYALPWNPREKQNFPQDRPVARTALD
eukprot:7176822-Alexandrium_andersonii.AAC.1